MVPHGCVPAGCEEHRAQTVALTETHLGWQLSDLLGVIKDPSLMTSMDCYTNYCSTLSISTFTFENLTEVLKKWHKTHLDMKLKNT